MSAVRIVHAARAAFTLALAAAAPTACQDPVELVGFERMLDQPRGKAYRASRYFADGRLMQPPPEGVVAVNGAAAPRRVRKGLDGDAYVVAIPLDVDRPLIERGRDRFDTYCAACHGLTGDGESVVARHMALRKPPSLLAEPVRSLPAGRVFQVISDGYGLMPSYAAELTLEERWGIVAYVRALELRAATELDRLPADARQRAEEALQ